MDYMKLSRLLSLVLATCLITGCFFDAREEPPSVIIEPNIDYYESIELNQENEINVDIFKTNEIETYKNSGLEISFNYYTDLELVERDNKVFLIGKSRDFRIQVPAESFEEYEWTNSDRLESGDRNTINISESPQLSLAGYEFKEYTQHGLLTYLIKTDTVFVKVESEQYLDSDEKKYLKEILRSLDFIN